MRFVQNLHQSFKAYRNKRAWTFREDNSFESYYIDDNANRILYKQLIEELNPKSIFEFGCYSGPNLKYFKNSSGVMLYGSDINSNAIDYAEKMLPNANFLRQKNLSQLDVWLPSNIDITLIASVFYTMTGDDVKSILNIAFGKSKYVLIGCNFENFDGEESIYSNGHFIHPWRKILSENGWKIVSRNKPEYTDYSVTEIALIQKKAIAS